MDTISTTIFIIIFLVPIICLICAIIVICRVMSNNLAFKERKTIRNYIILKITEIINTIIANNYSINDINNNINSMIDIYISNKCDSIVYYKDETKIIIINNINNHDPILYHQRIRKHILDYIIYKLKLIRKNELNNEMILELNIQKTLLSNDEFNDLTIIKTNNLKSTLKNYISDLNKLFISIEEDNQLNNEVDFILNINKN